MVATQSKPKFISVYTYSVHPNRGSQKSWFLESGVSRPRGFDSSEVVHAPFGHRG